MAKKHLAVYLNDHLAGGVAALELLAYLQRGHPDSDLARAAKALEAEIAADHDQLTELVRRAGIGISRIRQAVAWIGGRATELKMTLDDPADGPLRLLEILELLSLGVEGKRSLWLSLMEVAPALPVLQNTDFVRLRQRAEEQRDILETLKISAARVALGSAELAAGDEVPA